MRLRGGDDVAGGGGLSTRWRSLLACQLFSVETLEIQKGSYLNRFKNRNKDKHPRCRTVFILLERGCTNLQRDIELGLFTPEHLALECDKERVINVIKH